MNKRFLCYFWFVGWDCVSFGFHVCVSKPNIEVHVPFGFLRIGWDFACQEPRWQTGGGPFGKGFGYFD